MKDFSIAQLRTKIINEERVWVNDPGQEGVFQYDSSDNTSADDTGTIIVGQLDGKRWKRFIEGGIQPEWFGAVGDGVTDDTVAIQALWNYIKSNGGVAYITKSHLITETYISAGMVIEGNGSGEFILKNNQSSFTRMLTTENDLWVDEALAYHSPYLTVRNLKFNGNRTNQGTYTGGELEQQHAIFLAGCDGTNADNVRLRVVIENCEFQDTCGDGVSVSRSVEVKVSNCNFWNCFRGSVVQTGGNSIVHTSNITGGGDVHNSFFQAEVDGAVNGSLYAELHMENSRFEALHGAETTGTGCQFGFKEGSTVLVSNTNFKAGISSVYSEDSTINISNSFIRQIENQGNDTLVKFGSVLFSGCRFLLPIGNVDGRLLSARDFGGTDMKAEFDNCFFDVEAGYHNNTPVTISNASYASTLLTVDFGANHGAAVGDYIELTGFTPVAYNGVWRVRTVPTSTQLTIRVAKNFGAVSAYTDGTLRKTADVLYMPASDVLDNNPIIFKNCRVADGFNRFVNLTQGGKLLLIDNEVNSAALMYASTATTYPYDIYIEGGKYEVNTYMVINASVDNGSTLRHSNLSIDENSNCFYTTANITYLTHIGKRTILGTSAPAASADGHFKGDEYVLKIPVAGSAYSYVATSNVTTGNSTSWKTRSTLAA